MSVLEVGALALLLLGAAFCLLAAVGVMRLPDVYCRLSATSKAAPLGVGLVLAGASLAIGEATFTLQSAAVAVFVALTSPVAAHALGRAAHRAGVPPCESTLQDEAPGPDGASAERGEGGA